MSDSLIINRHIDAMELRPVADEQLRRAALCVCSVMGGRGEHVDQIRAVLEALGLDDLAPRP
jgi:hypothetical protein